MRGARRVAEVRGSLGMFELTSKESRRVGMKGNSRCLVAKMTPLV